MTSNYFIGIPCGEGGWGVFCKGVYCKVAYTVFGFLQGGVFCKRGEGEFTRESGHETSMQHEIKEVCARTEI